MNSIADPEAAFWRQQLEQDGSRDERRQRGQREQDAMPVIGTDRYPMPDDQGNANDAQQKTRDLAPGQRLPEQQRSQDRGEYRIGADDQGAKSGRDRFQPDITEAEIERIIGDAENGEDRGVAPSHLPGFHPPGLAAKCRDQENQNPCKQEARREQDRRWAIGDPDLAGDEGEAPQQAEQADIDRQRVERGAGRHGGRCKRHRNSPLHLL